MTLTLRNSTPDDLPAMQAIYAQAVARGTGTFELEPPSVAEMAQRRDAVLAAGWPWLVAQRGEQVLGYAYAAQYRPRRAYRFCVEDSIYLDEAARGQGVGRALLTELLARCEASGARQVLAFIGDADNAGSVALHRSLGFQHAGVLKDCGWKFERWLDVTVMQKALGDGNRTAPED